MQGLTIGKECLDKIYFLCLEGFAFWRCQTYEAVHFVEVSTDLRCPFRKVPLA